MRVEEFRTQLPLFASTMCGNATSCYDAGQRLFGPKVHLSVEHRFDTKVHLSVA